MSLQLRRPATQRIALVVAICSGSFCAAAIFLAVSPRFRVKSEFIKRPAVFLKGLSCDEPHHNYGAVRVGQIVQHTFCVQNNTNETRHILKVVPGCGCTRIVSFSGTIAPQTSGHVVVAVDTDDTPGVRQSSISVATDDLITPSIHLSIACEVRPSVVTSVEMLLFEKKPGENSFPSKSFDVSSLFADESIVVSGDKLGSSVSSADCRVSQPGRKYIVLVSVDGNASSGVTYSYIDLKIDGASQRSLRMPITIVNESFLKADPPYFDIAEDDEEDVTHTADFVVKTLDGSPLEIRKVILTGTDYKLSQKQKNDSAVALHFENIKATRALKDQNIDIETNLGPMRIPIQLHELQIKKLRKTKSGSSPKTS